VADGVDAPRRLFRLHFGDGKLRWAPLESVEKGWKAAGDALLLEAGDAIPEPTLSRLREGRDRARACRGAP
jgi:hypothetical protein